MYFETFRLGRPFSLLEREPAPITSFMSCHRPYELNPFIGGDDNEATVMKAGPNGVCFFGLGRVIISRRPKTACRWLVWLRDVGILVV